MRYQYVVILKRGNERAVDLLSILLCLFSVVSFLYQQLLSHHFTLLLSLCAGIVLGGLVFNAVLTRRRRRAAGAGAIPVRYRYWMLIAAMGWLLMPFLTWLVVPFALLGLLESQTKYPLEIGFDREQVVINSLIKREIRWSAFNNVILKDGLLTLDFKNNRLLQKEVLDDGEEEADEDEFNAFCRERLAEAQTA